LISFVSFFVTSFCTQHSLFALIENHLIDY
jgi:hypothetical protein